MDILDQIQNGPFTIGPEPEWVKKGGAFLEDFSRKAIKVSCAVDWEGGDIQWDASIGMYALVDREGHVRGWIGRQALQAMIKLAKEVGK
jgi:hypothetical protein